MKGSAVKAFRSIIDKFHPQVALSQTESHRLLNALTTSFRKQLESTATGDHVSSSPSVAISRRTASSPASVDHARSHLASFLTNPLLAKSTKDEHDEVTSTLSQASQRGKHPMKVFEDYVAAGHATLETARLCLEAFRRSLGCMSKIEAQKELLRVDAGLRVLRWLWSSPSDSKQMFVDGQKLLHQLSYFLVEEGREDSIRDWITTITTSIMTSAPVKTVRKTDPRALLLRSLLAIHLHNGRPDAAIRSFLWAVVGDTSPEFAPIAPTSVFRSVGAYLCGKLVDTPVVLPSTPDFVSLYDSLVQSCAKWDVGRTAEPSYRAALLKLHHPVNANPADALHFVRHVNQNPTQWPLPAGTLRKRSNFLQFLFDTVTSLQQLGLHDDATWVMAFMRGNYGDQLLDESVKESTTNSRLASTLRSPIMKRVDYLENIEWKAPVPG